MRLDAHAISYLKDYLQAKSSNLGAAKGTAWTHTNRPLEPYKQTVAEHPAGYKYTYGISFCPL